MSFNLPNLIDTFVSVVGKAMQIHSAGTDAILLSHLGASLHPKAASRMLLPKGRCAGVSSASTGKITSGLLPLFIYAGRKFLTKLYKAMREFYQNVMAVVCRHTGFNEPQLLHDRHEIVTDARHLLVHLLGEKLTNQEIVHATGLLKQTVSRLLNGYQLRAKQKFSLRCLETEVRKEINKQHLTT